MGQKNRTYRIDKVIALQILLLDLRTGSRPQGAVRTLFDVSSDGRHGPGEHVAKNAGIGGLPLLLHVRVDGTRVNAQ